MKRPILNDLYTEKGADLSGTPHSLYPRPQLIRDSYLSLNGEWDFYEKEGAKKETIIVPFPPESLLSGIARRLGKDPCPIYEKHFSLPLGFKKDRVILHFGAVDQIARVIINGIELGTHVGGYDAFSFDVTDHLKDDNLLRVEVRDELSSKILPYGKQCEKRGGMWYTPVTGIWQTVWLESVPTNHVNSLKIVTDKNRVTIYANGVSDGQICIFTPSGDVTAELDNGCSVIEIEDPRYWSPEDPYLYYFTLTSGEDDVQSYFALRTLEIKEVDGISRLCLNGKPYFFHGVLDQGYFSDGIFTPAEESCLEDDVLAMKKLGFNMLRKHIKIEPELFYYYCDKHGMVVFQDMVNNGSYSFFKDTALPTIGLKRRNDKRLHKNKHSREMFTLGMTKTVSQLYNHPCVCYYTIFNEGWGQFCGDEAYALLKELDSSRFIDTASGWFSGVDSDVVSEHVYFKPVKLEKADKPTVLSEFGGYSYKLDENSFNLSNTYGYKKFRDRESFTKALEDLYSNEVAPFIKDGLCAAVYTQLSDVEDETNGLITYDRKVLKVDPEMMLRIASMLKI